MITYVAINLTNKKFQVGSTNDFNRRCKEHHAEKGNLEFQRSLRKNPENFYWVQGVDDGLDDRSEEQYMLDFYCGTVWCYNHNPSASAPPSPKGRSWTPSQREKLNREGENNPMFGKTPWNFNLPSDMNPMTGVKCPAKGRKGEENYAYGLKWFRKGDVKKRFLEHPGEGWEEGLGPRNSKKGN